VVIHAHVLSSHAGSFRTAHPGLMTGPLHDRFPGLDGRPGCLLEVMTGQGQRTLEEALRQCAGARFAGTVDRRRAGAPAQS
jgi:hypothetical protein